MPEGPRGPLPEVGGISQFVEALMDDTFHINRYHVRSHGKRRGARLASDRLRKDVNDVFVQPRHEVMLWLTGDLAPPESLPNWLTDQGPSHPAEELYPPDGESDES